MNDMSSKGRPESELHRSAQREGIPVTLTLDTAGFAVGAARTRSRPAGGGIAGLNQQRDRVAVAGGVR